MAKTLALKKRLMEWKLCLFGPGWRWESAASLTSSPAWTLWLLLTFLVAASFFFPCYTSAAECGFLLLHRQFYKAKP